MTVHDAATGEQLGELPDIGAVRIAPDGTLVAGNYAGEITDVRPRHPPTSSAASPRCAPQARSGGLQFSADGRIMMASALDRTASIYDVASRTRIGDPITRQLHTAAEPLPAPRRHGRRLR